MRREMRVCEWQVARGVQPHKAIQSAARDLRSIKAFGFAVAALVVALLAAPAFASATPTATTEPASNVQSTEATLAGAVNPEGVDTHYQFEYGTTKSYGHSAPASAVDVGAGKKAIRVEQGIGGLASRTEYHFRVVATSGTETVYGADQAFTTEPGLYWYRCVKQTGGKYKNSECGAEGSPNEWELTRLKEGEKLNVVVKGGPFVLESKAFGLKIKIKCETEKADGWIENPASGGNGLDSSSAEFTGCTVPVPEGLGCKAAEPIDFAANTELITTGGDAWDEFTPKSKGTSFGDVKLEKCTSEDLNTTYPVAGKTAGLVDNASSTLSFSASMGELTYGGAKAKFEGESAVEIEGGGRLQVGHEPGSPNATTESASNVGAFEGTLVGTVNPNRIDTHYQFEYGTTRSYGQSAPLTAEDIGAGISNVKVTQTISGLTLGTEYHFRVVATNSSGTVYGADQTFKTASTLHWYGCVKQAGGKYKNSGCGETGSPGEWEWTKLKEGEKVNVVSSGGPITLTPKIDSITFEIRCEKRKDEGWVENPTGGRSAVGTTKAELTNCTVPRPEEQRCKVAEPWVFAGSTELVTVSGKAEEKYFPTADFFTELKLEHCESTSLNTQYPIAGFYDGVVSNKSSSQKFSSETSELTLGGTHVGYEGEADDEIKGGGGLKVD